MVAQAWLVLEITGSATWVGLTFAAQTLPILLVGPYGGLVADRTDKRRLLVALQVVMGALALLLAVLTLTDRVQLWHVLVLAALLGVADAFEKPTRQSFLVEIVGPESVRNAVSLNSVMVNAARVLGPAVAGLVIAAGGLGCLRPERRIVRPGGADAAGHGRLPAASLDPAALTERGQVRAGFTYVRRERELGVPLLDDGDHGVLHLRVPGHAAVPGTHDV